MAGVADAPLEGERLFHAEDVVAGIFHLTTVMDIAEVATDLHFGSFAYPSFRAREWNLRSTLKAHPLYLSSEYFQDTVSYLWSGLKLMERTAGLTASPFRRDPGWSFEAFKQRASPFGVAAYEAIRRRWDEARAAKERQAEAFAARNRRAIEREFIPDPTLHIPILDEF